MTKPVVLLLGATGLFGSLLAQRLIKEGWFDVVCSGRNIATLSAFCDLHGGRFFAMDRDDDEAVEGALQELEPFAVIDCAGPFQAYGEKPYKFARAAIQHGCHYLDIADAGEFVKGFESLNNLAKEKGVVALSGSSSTPAISSSVVGELARNFDEIHSITTVIIPGNRAKRTLSVMRAVLSQIGRPMRITRHGESETVLGWGETERFDLNVEGKRSLKGRLASLMNTPDVIFFPARYGANSVLFKAGLELKTFHYALVFGRWLVSKGLLKSLEPASSFLRWVASWFEWMGSDEGGMKVSVLGRTTNRGYERHEYDLIVDDGKGPNIPTLPVSIMLHKILSGSVKTGARACLDEFTLEELDVALSEYDGKTQIHVSKAEPVFKQALGTNFDKLPEPVKALHNQFGKHVYEGRASIKGATGLLGMIASMLVGFPKASDDIPVRVTITGDEKSETWVREFGKQSFLSHLSIDEDGFAQERFGPLSMRLGLELREDKLLYPVVKGRLFGFIPFPLFILPQSISHEEVDDEGRFVFDVLLKFRFGGRIAHYQGWLVRKEH